MVNVNAKAITFSNGTANDASQIDSEHTSLFNNDQTLATAVTNIQNDYITRELMAEFIGGLVPSYSSASAISVAKGRMVDTSQNVVMTTSIATTVSMATLGAVNGIAQSAALTGTIDVSSGAATVTGHSTTFQTDFQVGDVIYTNGGQGRRITVISSNTSITVESNWGSTETGVAYKRGGEAPNTWYNLYMIYNGTTSGFLLSTRNIGGGDTLADLPTGYTRYNQLRLAIRNNSNSDIIPFIAGMGWPQRPFIKYLVNLGDDGAVGDNNLLNAGTAIATTDIDCSSLIPPISRMGYYKGMAIDSTAAVHRLTYAEESGIDQYSIRTVNSSSERVPESFFLRTDTSQKITYIWSAAPTVGAYIWVAGFVVTEI